MDFSRIALEGKAALITGGSSGIGRATALAFADAGADVAISARKLPDLELVAEEIKAKGRKSLAVASHIAKVEESKNLVEKVKEEFGRIDILVNNAGTDPWVGPLMDTEDWVWDVTMNVNVRGPFLLSRLVARIMQEQGGGSIINISSTAGLRPEVQGIYSVTKAAMVMLTKVMAKEWGQYNIRVNTVAPGFTKTHLNEKIRQQDPSVEVRAAKEQALGRLGEPEDIAGAVLFLASDAASYITGATILADGGRTVGTPTAPWIKS